MNKKWFTLIELIVWITISMILMVSVGVFINSGMQNIFIQQKVLENTDNFTDFSNSIHTNFNLIQSWSFAPVNTASWIIFKRWLNYWEWGFSYIWSKTLSWVYCDSSSEDPETKNIYIKNFIPFEEQWEDIFTNYDNIIKSKLLIGWYQSFQKEHIIRKSWNILIWKWIFWNKFKEWTSWTWIYLNSPTWLTLSWNILFISDTLNNRILYYDTIWDKIYKLLDESDWLNEPTGLYYNDTDKALYIANSWKWEILKYSSKQIVSNPVLNLSFSWITANNINKFNLEFFTWSISITNPINNSDKWDFAFTNINNNDDYLTWSTNKLEYYFANYLNSSASSIVWCSTDKTTYYLSWNNPQKDVITWCNSSTWTLITYSWNLTTNFISWTTYNIGVSNISPLLNATWSYYVNLKLFNWASEKYSWYFPYFTQSDDNILTPEDNTLEILYSWLNYPTWIWWSWNTDYNIFWDWTYSSLSYNKTDHLLTLPIKSLNITNTSNDLITFILKYYKRYNCYNLDDNSQRTFILKKNLK